MSKVLVTGGAGYIGSHVVVELQRCGFEVIVVDDFSNSYPETLDAVAGITGVRPVTEEIDCNSFERMNRLFNKYKPIDAIIHCAASRAANESLAAPIKYYRNNINSLLNLLELSVEYKVKGLVFASTCAVYGVEPPMPVKENETSKDLNTPYSNTKLMNEEMIQDVLRCKPCFHAISLRYFTPVGAHPSILLGENTRYTQKDVVTCLTECALGIKEKFEIYGTDYNTPDGTCVRDFVDIMDVASANVMAVKRIIEGRCVEPFETFNLGSGTGTSVKELVKFYESITGSTIPVECKERRKGDLIRICADTTKAEKLLGWKAETPLSVSIKTAINWQKKLRNIN